MDTVTVGRCIHVRRFSTPFPRQSSPRDWEEMREIIQSMFGRMNEWMRIGARTRPYSESVTGKSLSINEDRLRRIIVWIYGYSVDGSTSSKRQDHDSGGVGSVAQPTRSRVHSRERIQIV